MNKKIIKKYLTIITLLVVCILILQNCERDDICAEGTSTTPRLKIEFYDAENPEDLKSVTSITVYGEGLILDDQGMEIEPTESTDKTIIFNSSENSVDLPLRIDDDIDQERTITRFVLEKDSNLRIEETGDSNVDIIEISYIPQFEYVSRACGFKGIFSDLNVTFDDDGDTWINSITVDITNVENENTIHVRIFH